MFCRMALQPEAVQTPMKDGMNLGLLGLCECIPWQYPESWDLLDFSERQGQRWVRSRREPQFSRQLATKDALRLKQKLRRITVLPLA
jgi:hypothetical protein